ncbi:hypothetical protein WOLCODRAFT_100005 [Wolfiporia cocos MD-104 SS10]|uniref:Uncharacterized protein n=1 Tax=Wolfiporia cocos (strain MD-104) TaxID=742152 RepID=A0A2H3JMR0_WOLCO|nr:hypothetical protein WOLCODRAFT_100005 [Wolfiporia cocos MD-104 SS10]
MSNTDQQQLLRILEAHGQQFLESFSSSVEAGKRKDANHAIPSSSSKRRRVEEESTGSESEWSGIVSHDDSDGEAEEAEVQESSSDDEPRPGPSKQPQVVVFSDQPSTSASASKMSKAQMKAFMSSKVSKLTENVEAESSDDKSDDEEDELTNMQNDKLLHHLVHTRLLSGSLNPELDLTPAQRRKALAGRVLEAAGKAKLGEGERAVRTAERNKAAKRMREGLIAKQKQRDAEKLEEAKLLGNYHPSLKKLYESSQPTSRKRKREKGLGMGVGSFKGGVLKLSREEINSVEGKSGRGRGGKKRGGKR